MHSTHYYSLYWSSILILSSHQCLGLSIDSFLQVYTPKPCCTFVFLLHTIWPANLILKKFGTWIIFGDGYNSRRFSFCNYSCFLLTHYANYLIQHPILCSSSVRRRFTERCELGQSHILLCACFKNSDIRMLLFTTTFGVMFWHSTAVIMCLWVCGTTRKNIDQ
jgi:hypothetical protein